MANQNDGGWPPTPHERRRLASERLLASLQANYAQLSFVNQWVRGRLRELTEAWAPGQIEGDDAPAAIVIPHMGSEEAT